MSSPETIRPKFKKAICDGCGKVYRHPDLLINHAREQMAIEDTKNEKVDSERRYLPHRMYDRYREITIQPKEETP